MTNSTRGGAFIKRLWIAAVILIIVPTLIFITHIYLHNATDSMNKIISSAQSAADAGDKKEAANQIAAFEKSWDSDKRIIGCFVRHSELDTVNQSTAKLMPYLEDENITDFTAECDNLKMQLHHIMETEKFSFDNLL